MGKRIAIIDGHPDFREERFVHALARAYRNGAETAGHEVRDISIGMVDFPLLRTSVVGMVEGISDARRKHWLTKLNALGRRCR